MARFTPANEEVAREIISRYPVPKSAVIPLCHLAQEQDGSLTEEAMEHVAELTGVTPAEVLGTASFYEMFKRHDCGRYLVNICTSISCHLMGGDELFHHAEEKLGIKAGATTADGLFTLESCECQAACTEAPALQVNYRYFHKVTPADFDTLVDDLRAGKLADTIPPHGTLARIRQRIPADRAAGVAAPTDGTEPVWLRDEAALRDPGASSAPAAPAEPAEPAATASAEETEPATEPATALDAPDAVTDAEGRERAADESPSPKKDNPS